MFPLCIKTLHSIMFFMDAYILLLNSVYTQHAYEYNLTLEANWQNAKRACYQKGLRLAVLNTQRRFQMAADYLDSVTSPNIVSNIWIGMRREKRNAPLLWLDDTPETFANWYPGEPNNDQTRLCVRISNLYYGWQMSVVECGNVAAHTYLCGSRCGYALISGQYPISDSQLSASSSWSETNHGSWNGWITTPERSRLNTTYFEDNKGLKYSVGWSTGEHNLKQYIQVEFNETLTVTGVKTRGGHSIPQWNSQTSSQEDQHWVKVYALLYSVDGVNFTEAFDLHGNSNFTANTDNHTTVKNILKQPVTAKFIRLKPLEWHVHITLRWDILGCYDQFTDTAQTSQISTESSITTTTAGHEHTTEITSQMSTYITLNDTTSVTEMSTTTTTITYLTISTVTTAKTTSPTTLPMTTCASSQTATKLLTSTLTTIYTQTRTTEVSRIENTITTTENVTTTTTTTLLISTIQTPTKTKTTTTLQTTTQTTTAPSSTTLTVVYEATTHACCCDNIHTGTPSIWNLTSQQLQIVLQELRKELLLDTSTLSSTVRRLTSAHDDRVTSRAIGAFGIALLSLIFIFIVTSDVNLIYEHLKYLLRNVKILK